MLYIQFPNLPNIFPTGTTEPPPILDPVPPSPNPPENSTTVETIQCGPLILNATANATGMIPHTGLITFYMTLIINVTNTSNDTFTDLHVVKVSVYNLLARLFYTFSVTPDDNITIPANESLTLTYRNAEYRVESSVDPIEVYARVLILFDTDQECILTTPILTGTFAIE